MSIAAVLDYRPVKLLSGAALLWNPTSNSEFRIEIDQPRRIRHDQNGTQVVKYGGENWIELSESRQA